MMNKKIILLATVMALALPSFAQEMNVNVLDGI